MKNLSIKSRFLKRIRRGAITVLAAVLTIVLLAMVAFSVDLGYVMSVKEEMQRTADSAALAALWEYGKQVSDMQSPEASELAAREAAEAYAAGNAISNVAPQVNLNPCNDPSGDVVFGYVSDLYSSSPQFDTTAVGSFNAVRVKIRRDETLNGEVPYFFAKVFGLSSQSLQADATAALVRDVRGFRTPSDGGYVEVLPFALDLETWTAWMEAQESGEPNEVVTDDWTWNEQTQEVTPGSDGWFEVSLFPQGTGSPGNRGTVDIGSSNNSTADISRQILHGISSADLEHHGGSLEFDANGELFLEGDTGISAGMKDELAAIKGQPRSIPIFREVNGPGNNAIYTIVKWMGITITDVKLTGPMNKKHVTIQAAPIIGSGVIPSSVSGTSYFVYSPVVLLE